MGALYKICAQVPLFKLVDKWYTLTMIEHELHPEGELVIADLRATTKVGLMTSAVEALAAAMKPSYISEDEVEQSFSVEASDYAQLIVAVLAESIRLSEENNEVYEGVRFKLITGNKAEGEFVGQVINGKAMHVASVEVQGSIEKNEDKEWAATVSFS